MTTDVLMMLTSSSVILTFTSLSVQFVFSLQADIAILFECLALFVISGRFFSLGYNLSQSILLATLSVTLHIMLVVSTVVIYRLSPIHPLARFPGPLINKVTSLTLAHIVLSGKRHTVIEELHKEYGKFVRTGPNTLSINSFAAIGPIYRESGAFDKAENYYTGRRRGTSLFFLRGRNEHNHRKKYWSGAFTGLAVRSWDEVLKQRTLQLLQCIRNRRDSNGDINMTLAFQHWSYDVMGSLTFGKSSTLELMSEGDPEGWIRGGQQATILFETFKEVSSCMDLLRLLPMTAEMSKLESLSAKFMKNRVMDVSPSDTDLASYLLGEHNDSLEKLSEHDLSFEALVAMQAGSDTTASVLTFLFYFIVKHSRVFKKLHQELIEVFPDPGMIVDSRTMSKLPYLNAVINESLRLGSPFSGLPRVVPVGGAMIDGKYVPAGTTVGVPIYSQEIHEENFWPKPLEFLPERWLPGGLGPGTRTNPNAILAFSCGPFGCVGRGLAIQELRTVVVYLVLSFTMKLSPQFDERKFQDGTRNMLTTHFDHPLTTTVTDRQPDCVTGTP